MRRSISVKIQFQVKRFLRWLLCLVTHNVKRLNPLAPKDERKLRILMYHNVTNACDLRDSFCVTTSNFMEQMRILAETHNVIALGSGIEQLAHGDELPPKAIAITFDDGYRGVLDNAVPVLEYFKLPATVFLRCDVLNDGNQPGRANGQHLHLGWPEAKILLQKGLTIGAHTISHRSLARIPAEEIARETAGAKEQIEIGIGCAVRLFAYPYGTGGDFDSKVIESVRDAGFSAALTAINGTNDRHRPIYALRRTKVEGGDSLKTFQRLIEGGMDAWMLIDRFGWWLQRKRK